MNKTSSFILSAYSFVFKYSLDKLLEVGHKSKNGNPIPSFDENILITLCSDAKEIFEKENNVLEIKGDVAIVGDIHGSFHDLIRILSYFQQNQKKVLFLGDFVDRGNFSLECITLLFALKVIRPDLFFLIRGNHEFDFICSNYGFKKEILNYYDPRSSNPNQSILTLNLEDSNNDEKNQSYQSYVADHNDMNCYKYSELLYDAFINAFAYIPIAAIVNDTTFCIHGGLSPKLEHVDDLNRNIIRPISTFQENQLLSDVIWSDPCDSFHFVYRENFRGSGFLFNHIAVNIFLKNNSLKRIVRAHECVKNGVKSLFEDTCITVFSASSYDKSTGNCSGILEIFEKDDRVEFKSFPPIERLQKDDTLYYKVQNQDPSNRIPFSLLYPFLNTTSSQVKLTPNFKIRKGKTRNSYNSINYTRQTQLIKPSFTTKPRRSLHHNGSVANINIASAAHANTNEKANQPKIVVSHSMPVLNF